MGTTFQLERRIEVVTRTAEREVEKKLAEAKTDEEKQRAKVGAYSFDQFADAYGVVYECASPNRVYHWFPPRMGKTMYKNVYPDGNPTKEEFTYCKAFLTTHDKKPEFRSARDAEDYVDRRDLPDIRRFFTLNAMPAYINRHHKVRTPINEFRNWKCPLL